MHDTSWRLLADIGGTNARFALEAGAGGLHTALTLPCADYPRFEDAVHAYLAHANVPVAHAVVAIANPVDGDAIRMTNHHWAFSIEAARAELGLATLLVVNDFTALAMALPGLGLDERMQVGGGVARAGSAIGLVGAGTGLGVSGLVPAGERWAPLHSEGGHVAFSPLDEREVAVLRYCWQRYDHVSAERFVSGPGIALVREALAAGRGIAPDAGLTPAAIVERALSGGDALSREAVDCFCGMLGTVAANLAVTLGAQGGVYIGGGVVPRLGSYFAESPFRARFEKKGRFSAFTARIPTWVITAPYPALGGAARILAEHLDRQPAAPARRRLRAAPLTSHLDAGHAQR
ncbi:glucokinase [Massilia yuzhufengensis]|uniref:Glucokinase n=1 Tax=Massilia yuzhufengensis TaxID=1164594 RepID=A0A1I1LPC3_9BURK|nr:glucokinase [Massilia yuzhufengensis]SFC72123.1 glucokinase [Massilia yuzhufengensis]